jgi:uncharacterized membrane protein YphA (DoxX/SURF4 family)
MYIAYIAVAAVSMGVLAMSARMKLVRDPRAVEVISDVVGVPVRFFPVLALLEIAGGVGLLVGIGVKPLGVAAGVGLIVYFVVAISSHLRVRDLVGEHVGPAAVLLVVSSAAVALRLAA